MALNDPLECVAEWSRRFARGDSDGMAALYHEDGLLYGSAANVIVGRDAIRQYFSAVPAAVPPGGPMSAEFSDLVVKRTSPTTANVAGLLRFLVGPNDLATRISLAYALEEDGNWLIGLHHASLQGGMHVKGITDKGG